MSENDIKAFDFAFQIPLIDVISSLTCGLESQKQKEIWCHFAQNYTTVHECALSFGKRSSTCFKNNLALFCPEYAEKMIFQLCSAIPFLSKHVLAVT